MITVSLCVKYRAFGVTFGKMEKQWQIEVPIPWPMAQTFIDFNERGVTLKVVYQP